MNLVTTDIQSDILNYIVSSFETIVAEAHTGYKREGRGAMVIDMRQSPQVSGGYLSVSRILVEIGPLPNDNAGNHLQTYNPACEVVILLRLPEERVFLFKFAYEVE